jgi:magnesium transporter
MLTAYLFDERRGKPVEDWTGLVAELGEKQVLWVDLVDPSDDDERAVRSGFKLGDATLRAKEDAGKAELELAEGHIRVTAVAVSDGEKDPAREEVVIDCLMGQNWVLTSHVSEIQVIEDFRAQAEGAGELGALDAPSFVATLLEWVVTSYLRAFSEIESTLEDFDISVLTSPRGETEQQVRELVEARRRINGLRRALAPHREIFATLSHAELDLISTERSAERFDKLTEQTDAALASATEAKNAVASSFDVLILRTEHRTNEIMKVLTLASILLLPGALIAGVMGMNVNFKAGTFSGSPLFWTVLGLIVAIALATLGLARYRRWI